MSHTVNCVLKMKNPVAITRAANRLNLNVTGQQEHVLYDGKRVDGIAVSLPAWKYPVVIDHDGQLFYDNFRGNWGDISELDKFCQRYAVEQTILEAEENSYSYNEFTEVNGNVTLEIFPLEVSV